ncbi:hypothetical protein GGX14DRAFT_398307 [Mycena pura]|uniref:Uncharacterized protein n=1 Tax=Mycena pura TaxID=153505 RepID=A0AAD6V6Q0_9AGAR|nr:hypothetical protein GGX14DRAFT_398307 [Mycena pura]
MFLEGCPGLPPSLHDSPFQVFKAVWVEDRIDPISAKATPLTREDLAYTLQSFNNFRSSGIWLVPLKGPVSSDQLGPVSALVEKYFKSSKESSKEEDGREDAFTTGVMRRGERPCQITGENVSIQAAHLIPLAMGTSVLALIVHSFNTICNKASDFIDAGPNAVEEDAVFADIREQFPFDHIAASINNGLNGWVIGSHYHDAQDRHRRWTRNPVTNHLIWLCNPTSETTTAKMSFGFWKEGLTSEHLKLRPEDPRAIFCSNTEGHPVVQQPKKSFMLHCCNMLLVFAYRYLSYSKRRQLKAVAKVLARKLLEASVESSGGAEDKDEGRPLKRIRLEEHTVVLDYTQLGNPGMSNPNYIRRNLIDSRKTASGSNKLNLSTLVGSVSSSEKVLLGADIFSDLLADTCIMLDEDDEEGYSREEAMKALRTHYPHLPRSLELEELMDYHENQKETLSIYLYLLAGLAANAAQYSE